MKGTFILFGAFNSDARSLIYVHVQRPALGLGFRILASWSFFRANNPRQFTADNHHYSLLNTNEKMLGCIGCLL